MEATLEEQETFVRIRTSKVPGAEIQYWTDSLAHDYLHRPIQPEFERICFYQMTSEYKKEYKKYKATKFDKYEFSENHPGHEFSRLSKLKYPTIPKISLPPYKLCSLEELDLHHEKSTEKSYDKRETYAKMALIMFYPYRTLNDLKIDGSFWKQFNKQRQRYINGKQLNSGPRDLTYFKILKTSCYNNNMSNVLGTLFQLQPSIKSHWTLTKPTMIERI